jgi:Rieske 2Fe-2S family protein
MPSSFKKEENSLHEIHCREVNGLIFISLIPKNEKLMWEFDPADFLIRPQIKPHGLENAKIAFSATYQIRANWKLVYENNRECYHW